MLDQSYIAWRPLIFFIGLALFYSLGVFFSFRSYQGVGHLSRLGNHLGLAVLSSLLFLVIPGSSLIYIAHLVEVRSIGVMNVYQLPLELRFLIGLISLDFIIYWQHRFFHFIPWLWRLHAVHHSDTFFDTTTALRFHPLEIVISFIVKAMAITFLGIPASAAFIFEILINFSAMFNHSNFTLPRAIENHVRKLMVTPDFHRVHHSIRSQEMHHNYGFFLSIWDFMFRSYCSETKEDPQVMPIGLDYFRRPQDQKLLKLLFQPFRSQS